MQFPVNMTSTPSRLIIGMTGATGGIFGVRLLEVLRESDVETHLVLSKWAIRTLQHETEYSIEEIQRLAGANYRPEDQGARISSGSFITNGMVICPCSVRTLAAIAQGNGDHLIHRAADVILKERRKLVLVVREAPFNEIHLENMLKLSRMGAVILPPVPAFYNHPQSIDDIVNHVVMRILDQFNLHLNLRGRWDGMLAESRKPIVR